jgi:hypothetical protein
MKQGRREAHVEALRAAARVALSAAVLGGCAPAPAVTQAPVTTQSSPAPPAAPAPAEPPVAPAEAPVSPDPTLDAVACAELRRQSFPDQFSRIDPGTAPPALRACCEDRVLQHGYDVPCCSYLFEVGAISAPQTDGDSRKQRVLRGCSPWGPPMPPAAVDPIAWTGPRPRRLARASAKRRTLSLRSQARRAAPTIVARPGIARVREVAVATWRTRMVNEHGSARVFEGLAHQLERAGLAGRDEALRFAAEERRHGVLCGAVVEALGAQARGVRLVAEPYPLHADAASALEAALRDVLSICCLSETVAVALIGAERLEMPTGELRDLLTEIYADEIGHARFGWGLLARLTPSLEAATKQALSAYLAIAFAHLERHELAHLPADAEPPPDGHEYGLCSGRDARVLFYDTMEQIIVPGLERHGLAAGRAWRERHTFPG